MRCAIDPSEVVAQQRSRGEECRQAQGSLVRVRYLRENAAAEWRARKPRMQIIHVGRQLIRVTNDFLIEVDRLISLVEPNVAIGRKNDIPKVNDLFGGKPLPN